MTIPRELDFICPQAPGEGQSGPGLRSRGEAGQGPQSPTSSSPVGMLPAVMRGGGWSPTATCNVPCRYPHTASERGDTLGYLWGQVCEECTTCGVVRVEG